MLSVIRELEKIPINIGSLRRAVPRDTKVMLYDQLPSRGTMSAVFGKRYKCIIMFYQLHSRTGAVKDGTGHYSTILKLGKSKYEFFSSYGMKPEEEIHETHSSGKLLNLLGKNVIRSSAKLQQRYHSNTCARWAAARCILREVPLQIFVKNFSGRLQLQKPDDVVTLSTIFMFKN